jgi:glycosyltransferase involved in cell wall biosynthesis
VGLNDSSPRIAIVNDVAGVGSLQARVLREAGYEVDFIDLPKPGRSMPWYIKVLMLPIRLVVYLPTIWKLRRTPYAWLHVHFLSYGAIGVLAGKPFYLHGHGHDVHTSLAKPVVGWLSRFGMRRARAIFYVTPDLAPYLTEFRAKSFLLPNPLEPAFFASVNPPGKLEKLLLFTRLYPIKGPDEVFVAAPDLGKLVSLSAIAWGPLTADLREKYGWCVDFIDRIPHAEVPALVDRFDGIIGQMKLGILSLSELEAMARGRVVFMHLDHSLYPADPPPVVQIDDAASLVAAVRRLQARPQDILQLSLAGRDWIARHHTAASHLQVLRAVFSQAAVATAPSSPEARIAESVEPHEA